ncbi:amino acid adenylation domain-containing protein [Chitinophaga varians]|uniref:Amino acid adenylation domain-containing protein n=1 Tax=Chitinophaga varians TaxID=2202339 RepID=A0A847RND5_9BACT|nr:non-ribosomal peptide synthetase [Chitinophaga varians]NLR68499.1 amino acid adenylation domain-containing protein [Chitinophaga varians]
MSNKIFPLTSSQQDIFYEQCMFQHLPVYNIGGVIDMPGVIDVVAFRDACHLLISSNESMRCGLVIQNDIPMMELAEEFSLPFSYYNYADSPEQVDTFIKDDFSQPFDLMTDRLLCKFVLFRLAEDKYKCYFKCHHIVADGWATGLLFKQLTVCYKNILAGTNAVVYKGSSLDSYVREDQAYIGSDLYETDATYWRKKFSDYVEDEPLFQVRGSLDTAVNRVTLSQRCGSGLSVLCKKYDVSPLHIVLAAVYITLFKITDRNEMVIGVPVLNRSGSKSRNTTALFMKVTPLLMKITGEQTICDLVLAIKDGLRQDFRHAKYPVSKMLTNMAGGLNEPYLFDVLVSYEKHAFGYSFGDFETSVSPLIQTSARAALSLFVHKVDGEQLVFDVASNIELFGNNDTIAGYLEKCLENIIFSEDPVVKSVDIMDLHVKNRLLYNWGSGQVVGLGNAVLPDLFQKQVDATPEALALLSTNLSLKYNEVDRLSNAVANLLRSQYQLKPGSLVAVSLNRSIYFTVTIMAIWKAGCAYLPLDPSVPEDRNTYILGDSGAEMLITDDIGGRVAGYFHMPVVSIQQLTEQADDGGAPNITVDQAMLAYVIYTSGSTGLPKGVEISHRALVNFMRSMLLCPGLSGGSMLLSITTYSFDISILELFWPLLCGGCVFMADSDTVKDPELIVSLMEAVKPDIMQATPTMWKMILEAGWKGDSRLMLLCGGEKLEHSLGKELLAKCRSLWNMYGPTETTIWSTLRHIDDENIISNIGRPFANTQVYVLNENRQLLPPGFTGEIFIAGEGLAIGYRSRPELTVDRFVPDPFVPSKLMYATGDLGKWSPDGELGIIGRRDGQIKIRGFRIETGEIEYWLNRLPFVSMAVVVPESGDNGDVKLVACYTIKQDFSGPIGTNDIIRFLVERLPGYMVPERFVCLQAFPLTPNGKIDRKALKGAVPDLKTSDISSHLGESSRYGKMIRLWKAFFQTEAVGENSDFFRLGGNSLRAIQLVSAIRKEYGLTCSFAAIFRCRSLAAITDEVLAGNVALPQTIPVAPLLPYYPLTYMQMGIWLRAQKGDGSFAYHMSALVKVKGKMDIPRFVEALKIMKRRHIALRTQFGIDGDKPVQYFQPADNDNLSFNYFDAVAEPEKSAAIVQATTETALDLQSSPPWRVSIVRAAEEEYVVIACFHHIIIDGYSVNLFVRELGDVYNQLMEGAVSYPDKATITFRDYVSWRALLPISESPVLPGLILKYDKPVISSLAPLAQISLKLDADHFGKYRQLITEAGVTPYVMVLALSAIVCSSTSGETMFSLGGPGWGRSGLGLEHEVGIFIEMLEIPFNLNRETSFITWLREQQDLMIRYADSNTFRLRPQVTDIVVSHELSSDMTIASDWLNGAVSEFIPLPVKVAKFALSLNYVETDNTLTVNADFNSQLFENETIWTLLSKFPVLLDLLHQHPDTSIDQLGKRLHRFILSKRPRRKINFVPDNKRTL